MLVYSSHNVDTNEVNASKELIGCHSGMGDYLTQPFLLYSVDSQLEEDELVGVSAGYRQPKTWLNQFKPKEAR